MPEIRVDFKSPQDKEVSSSCNQIFLSIVSNITLIGAGAGLGFTAVALPYMQQPSSPVYITTEESSWVASISSIATPVGCLSIGPLLDRFGRRIALLLITIPLFTGWLLISICPNLERIYLGRIVIGLAGGFASVASTVYVTEVVGVKLRGILITGGSLAISLGITIVYILGWLLKERWQWVAAICAVFPVISFFLIVMILPESPVWLVAKKRYEEAKRSLKRINKYSTEEAETELDEISHRFNALRKKSISFKNSLMAFGKPETYKPFFIMNFFFFFQQTAGTFVVIFYAVDVVKTTNVPVDAFAVTVFIGLIRLFFTIVSAWMSKTLGRRPTAIISGSGMTLSLLVLALNSYIESLQRDITAEIFYENITEINTITENLANVTNSTISPALQSTSFLPMYMLLAYILFGTLGFLTLPWSMIGEVYPDRVRGIAGGLTTSVAYTINFLVIKLYPTMKVSMNTYGLFGFYALMALLGTLFVIIFLPETEGKTLKEIGQRFSRKSKKMSLEEEETLENTRLPTIVKSPQNRNLK